MSDIREPNILGIARLEEKKSEMQLSLIRMKRRRLEMDHELKKLEENEGATLKVIAEIEQQIAAIPKEA